MAPKVPSSDARQPSKEKHENEFSSEEDDDDLEEEQEAHSSGEEEKESDDVTEEASYQDEEEKDQQEVITSKTLIPVPQFESESIVQEDVLDSDPDSEGSPSDYKLQPIPKPSVAPSKRTHEETDSTLRSTKKSKIEEKKNSSTPGGCITRLWSDGDEIAVLNGLIDFKNLKGLDPHADMGAFYNFIKGKLEVDFSRYQLRTKIGRLKKRFLNALKKCENPVFSKPHEDMAFELSKKIWGDNIKKDILKAKEIIVHEKEVVKEENGCGEGDIWSKYASLSQSFDNLAGKFPSLAMSEFAMSFVKERLTSIGNVKAKQLDEKWKQLIMEEMELNYKMLALMTEQVKMAYDH